MHTDTGHSNENAVVALRSMLPLVHEKAKTAWVHAARPGEFKGHPAADVFVFSRDSFETIIRNFKGQQNQVVPLTYDHPSYTGERPVELAGWVHDLRADDAGLWAFCEFTDDAVKLVRKGSYKFASVVVSLNSVHRETGEEIGPELLELAITSSPFIDGLSPLSLRRRDGTVVRVPVLLPVSAFGLTKTARPAHGVYPFRR